MVKAQKCHLRPSVSQGVILCWFLICKPNNVFTLQIYIGV